MKIKELSADEAEARLDELAYVLKDAVESGASVSFLLPFTIEMGRAFWRKVITAVHDDAAVLLGAILRGKLVGTVQLRLDTPANQQHRGEVVKLLVHRQARGKGVGRALMQELEKSARSRGRVLLVLDTHEGSPASGLYRSLGFACAGTVPGYAQLPLGGVGDTSVYYKDLRPVVPRPTKAKPTTRASTRPSGSAKKVARKRPTR
ncbi:GNAT family N-acetyltransferase [bacterium]|nr:GNAT family N-acetyltransferase [bacterium]